MEPFRTRELASDAPETPITPGPVQPIAKEIEEHHEQETPERIDIYEFEKGHKIADSYFGMREVALGDFNVKMSLARVDKYVKSVIESKQYDNTVDNYRSIIADIESKINSTKLMGKARMQRILTYITLMQKTDHIKKLKDNFFNTLDS